MSAALSIEQLLHGLLLASGIALVAAALLALGVVLLYAWRSEAAANRNKFGAAAR